MNPDQQDNHWQQDPEEVQDPQISQDADIEPQQVEQSRTENIVDDAPVSWVANEYVHLEKGGLWYVIVAIVVLGLISVDVFLLKSITFWILVVVMAIALIVYLRRAPRSIQYMLSIKQGLYIGEKLYNLADFKAFGLIRDGEHHSIMLIPTKRIALGVSVYFPEEVGEKIVDILGARLPMQNLKLDAIDVIVRQLRL
jgi:hypothetical protein